MNTITKSALIATIARRLQQLPADVVTEAVDHIIRLMTDTLAAGEVIEIRGFARFTVNQKPARQTQNPKTGEKLITPPKYKLHFKCGKKLHQRVNGS